MTIYVVPVRVQPSSAFCTTTGAAVWFKQSTSDYEEVYICFNLQHEFCYVVKLMVRD